MSITILSDATKRALANLDLEGITPTDALVADMQLLDAGKLSKEDISKELWLEPNLYTCIETLRTMGNLFIGYKFL